jgi:hypothetical protein
MKKVIFILVCMVLVSMTYANTSDTLAALTDSHKKAITNFGQRFDGEFSYAVVGTRLVSVVKSDEQASLYTEAGSLKIYTLVTITPGENPNEVNFNFENKLTVNNSTFDLKYTYIFDFGTTPGYRTKVTTNLRWDLTKCWDCIKCAAGSINELYTAYKTCGTNWSCWVSQFPALINLYNCVVNSCIPCFT